jgi:short-subunit dehydrogenase
VYAVHVKGLFLLSQYVVPQLNDGASIVITSSVAGMRGDPGVYAYITAKHAQIGMMRCLAKELKSLIWFWIPAHTITFMLPKPYQIGLAALWSIVLALILGIYKRQAMQAAESTT